MFDNFEYTIDAREFFKYPESSEKNSKVEERDILPSSIDMDPTIALSDYLVSFDSDSRNYCIGVVDMVNSTKIAAKLGTKKISKYYQIFLNSMSKIISRFGGVVIKNVGDCLVYYFPKSNKGDREALRECLESSLIMIDSHDMICEQLKKEGLPCVDYRISLEYGPVILMKSNNSTALDMIGTPVNMCTKINRSAEPNEVVIGADVYELVKHFNNYKFREIDEYSLGFKYTYTIYSLKRTYEDIYITE
jgi:class 3 adenylate cyclase